MLEKLIRLCLFSWWYILVHNRHWRCIWSISWKKFVCFHVKYIFLFFPCCVVFYFHGSVADRLHCLVGFCCVQTWNIMIFMHLFFSSFVHLEWVLDFPILAVFLFSYCPVDCQYKVFVFHMGNHFKTSFPSTEYWNHLFFL